MVASRSRFITILILEDKINKEVCGPTRIMKRFTATYPGLSCLYHAVVIVSSMVISSKAIIIGIIDYLALHFQIKYTGKVVCLVSVILELPFDDDESFRIFLCKTVRFRIHKSH